MDAWRSRARRNPLRPRARRLHFRQQAECHPNTTHAALDAARAFARLQLERPDRLVARPLIDYVFDLPLKSPRVVYNLACYYNLAATRNVEGEEQAGYLERAFELLHQSISRTPPLERRGLVERAETDPDLETLRHACSYSDKFAELRRLIPGGGTSGKS